MPSDDLHRQFAEARRAVVVAPAGCGKTELIARAVASCPSQAKQLVLTHTHAGVDALRARLRRLNVPPSRYHVETIHSFALCYAAAFPRSSSVKNVRPRTKEDYSDIIASAQRLMEKRLIRQILSLSYGGVFVDEYQDCTLDQHSLILKVAELLPCRIVGDPLQGIFDFGSNQIVDWDQHVYPSFMRLPDLLCPWRWKDGNPQLGKWLMETVRPALERRGALPLHRACQAGICEWTQELSGQHRHARRINVLLKALNHNGTTLVICPPKPEYVQLPHHLASSLRNHYRSIEPITSEELHHLAEEIERHIAVDRLLAVRNFADQCLTGQQDFDAVLKAIKTGGSVRTSNRRTLECLAKEVINEAGLGPVAALLAFIGETGNPTKKRRQLWDEMRIALAEVMSGTAPTLVEATHIVRNRAAVTGRRIPKRCISRTLLLKGLECEHAVVVDADSLDTKNLYVALTRASKSLHILSREKVLQATDARPTCPKCHSQLVPKMAQNGPFLACSDPTCDHTERLTT